MRTKLMLILLFAFLFVGSASAGTIIIDFATGSASGGTLSYDGLGGSLVGAGIGIGTVSRGGGGDPVIMGPFAIAGGSLNFTTGPLSLYDASSQTYYFLNPGGSLTITGGIPGWGIPADTPLLSAVNISATYSNGLTSLTLVGGNDTKDPGLLSHLSVTGNPSFEFLGTIHGGAGGGGTGANGGAFSVNVTTTDVSNAAEVPEPALLTLVGVGLMALGIFRRLS